MLQRHLFLSILSILLVTQILQAQSPIKDVFLTKEAFDAFITEHIHTDELGGRKLFDEEETKEIIFDSFLPTFDEDGKFESIELKQSNGKQYLIQRLTEQTYVVQKGRKKLRKRRHNISLEPEANNTNKSIRLWNHTWTYIEQMIPE